MNACGTGQTIELIINNEWMRKRPGAANIMEGLIDEFRSGMMIKQLISKSILKLELMARWFRCVSFKLGLGFDFRPGDCVRVDKYIYLYIPKKILFFWSFFSEFPWRR